MNTSISFYLREKDAKEFEPIPRKHDNGYRYWVLKMATDKSTLGEVTDVTIFVDDADFKTLSAKISTALEVDRL